eukprot:GFYU01010308.1.p1 GENE.GFYU01010308.1~~GFYU01010308.1.p1  ORF type:complete len:189 (-),score=44.92 GFYU01010308.1:182-703(-)
MTTLMEDRSSVIYRGSVSSQIKPEVHPRISFSAAPPVSNCPQPIKYVTNNMLIEDRTNTNIAVIASVCSWIGGVLMGLCGCRMYFFFSEEREIAAEDISWSNTRRTIQSIRGKGKYAPLDATSVGTEFEIASSTAHNPTPASRRSSSILPGSSASSRKQLPTAATLDSTSTFA